MPSADHAAQSSSPDRATGPAGSVPPTPPGVGPLPNPPTAEHRRLNEQQLGKASWCRWGPYLSERQWGTVREDYSPGGEAWTYLTHEAARSRAYRWGEDGLAGISDDNQRLCLSLALWNGRDPILKERPFGLTNSEGNHGEDVKELYYFLDATPTHSYLKMLYKYPQAAYPYERLVEENRRRDLTQPEFELIDTGAFDDGRYFDVFVEYAKFDTKSTLMQITACNRGPAPAELHLLPQLFFRNTWSWEAGAHRPRLSQEAPGLVRAEHEKLGMYLFHLETCDELLFTENDSNPALFGPPQPGFWKDGFHRRVVQGETAAVNSETRGTKAAGWIRRTIPAGGQFVLRAYLDGGNPLPGFKAFDQVLADRRREADEFYAFVQKDMPSDDARAVHRQALAGMIWSKQFYGYEITRWLDGDPAQVPPPEERKHGRNWEWSHFNSASVISMPDTWEYPWFAAWDLAFHCVAMAEIDPAFAKQQLLLLTREWFMHPNGQLPAYEWNFGDVNPPTHAWAAWRVYEIERDVRRRAGAPANEPGDVAFLERVFHKLTLNFTWWVNRKVAAGRKIFQGGFLGMDNVGVFDRSTPLPTGGYINQADGTAWMAMYSLNLMRISLELAQYNRAYEDMATKFFEHFLYIARAMT
ncbi:MAG: MGH1-like glycoside hydrolase domain-containing protein, partial [Planctomycetota bacterium]